MRITSSLQTDLNVNHRNSKNDWRGDNERKAIITKMRQIAQCSLGKKLYRVVHLERRNKMVHLLRW